jgi:hypothetical protein
MMHAKFDNHSARFRGSVGTGSPVIALADLTLAVMALNEIFGVGIRSR